jgi:hypothetical protein
VLVANRVLMDVPRAVLTNRLQSGCKVFHDRRITRQRNCKKRKEVGVGKQRQPRMADVSWYLAVEEGREHFCMNNIIQLRSVTRDKKHPVHPLETKHNCRNYGYCVKQATSDHITRVTIAQNHSHSHCHSIITDIVNSLLPQPNNDETAVTIYCLRTKLKTVKPSP